MEGKKTVPKRAVNTQSLSITGGLGGSRRGYRTADLWYSPQRSTHLLAGFLLCKAGRAPPHYVQGDPGQQAPALLTQRWAEKHTHLEHDFIDGRSVRFKVEVFIVVIA